MLLRALTTCIALSLLPGETLAQSVPPDYDVLIRGGLLVDGTGVEARPVDVGIRGDRIVDLGDLAEATATRVIEARGLYVTPGFIDSHSHAGGGLLRPALRSAQPLLAQGITTVLVNPDGGGPVDLASQRNTLERLGVGVNVAQFVPHGSVRRQVMGMAAREATPNEIERMRRLVRTGMEEGAVGLSSGLYYSPGSYAPSGEVIDLARVAAEFGGAYQSHIRDESDYSVGLVEAVDEVIRIAREAEIPGVVTHIKALGPPVWGLSEEVVRRIEAARASGVEVYADQYPYEASSTSIVGALVPRWALAGGDDALRSNMDDPEQRARLVADMWDNLERRGGAGRLVLQAGEETRGKTLEAVADDRGVGPIEAALQLLREGGSTGLTSFNMQEGDIRTLMSQPWTMTASDGALRPLGQGQPHPRNMGTFPRKIRKYVVEDGVLSLEQAVHGMTGLPAIVYGLEDRGVVREGAFADIVVFDLEELTDRATYDDPHRLSEGIRYAIVNGSLVVDEGAQLGSLFGRVLRKTGR
jgi:N-acyl-D-aspartate/D-glutamate deacylase